MATAVSGADARAGSAKADDPLWWTLRRPFRGLSYHAAYRMFCRANAALGSNWTLHDLRHTAAYRMARDPEMRLTDVQWGLGHALLGSTQIYLTPLIENVIAEVIAHYARRTDRAAFASSARVSPPAVVYRTETLNMLFGQIMT